MKNGFVAACKRAGLTDLRWDTCATHRQAGPRKMGGILTT